MSPLKGLSDPVLAAVSDVILISKDFVISIGVSINVSPIISRFMSLGLGAGSPETNDLYK